jgi:hypothetical protein
MYINKRSSKRLRMPLAVRIVGIFIYFLILDFLRLLVQLLRDKWKFITLVTNSIIQLVVSPVDSEEDVVWGPRVPTSPDSLFVDSVL